MAMNEIWAPKSLIVLFLALPLFRPFVKKFRPLDGLAWLPFIALCLTIGIFPAYGFRPECLGILIFAFCMSAARLLPLILNGVSHSGQKPLFTAFVFVLLITAAVPMFLFSPRALTGKETVSPAVINTSIQGKNYILKIYGKAQTNHPLIFLVPPDFGSASSVDRVCGELEKNNYTVITYIRRGHDPPVRMMKYLRLSRKAAELASVNEKGRALEARRREDMEILLPALPGLLQMTNMPPVLLAGYGAGGSALAFLAGESGFMSRNTSVLGAAVIESRLWSSYQQAPGAVSGGKISGKTNRVDRKPPVSDQLLLENAFLQDESRKNAGLVRQPTGLPNKSITQIRENIGLFFQNIKPRRVILSGILPAAGLPVLYVVSDRALASGGNSSYQAVFDVLRSPSGPVALAAVKGAGPLDYQDFPLTHPLYSFLLPGQKAAKKSNNPIGDTAALIGNFAALLLERAQATPEIPPRQPISGDLHIESRGLPGFRL